MDNKYQIPIKISILIENNLIIKISALFELMRYEYVGIN
jgi:hypothetical protein